MMKQEHIDIVAEAFRRGEFRSLTGSGRIDPHYDEAYIDEHTDYDFEHVFIHLVKDLEEGDLIEIMSVETPEEELGDQYAPARRFTDFYTKAMETKMWHLRMNFDPERKYETRGCYELYTKDCSIVAFYVVKMPGTR